VTPLALKRAAPPGCPERAILINMRSARLCLSLLLFARPIFGQTFEVASIKPSGPKSVRGSEGGPGSKDPTHYTFGRMHLDDFILMAYRVDLFQVSSKLPLDRDEFDLTARVPAGATKEDFRGMMRNLLVERFRFVAHIESREFPAFEMVLAKGPLKLGTEAATRLDSGDDFPKLTPGRPGMTARNSMAHGHMLTQIRGQQQPVSRLAEVLRTAEPRPVVDKTGLTGRYDFILEFAGDLPNGGADAAAEPAGAPDLNTALRDQLGLLLIAKKLPFDVVVVESFDRLPTEN
jgi:uncharacterized protein (TIGR03435 family)